jgi:hypothetical protein
MTGVTAEVGVYINGRVTRANDLNSVSADLNEDWSKAFVAGTGAGQGDLVFSDTRTIAASGTDNLDLAGGVTDTFGSTVTFVDVKAIIVRASAANTNDVQIGGAGSNPFVGPMGGTGVTTLKPGGFVCWVNPGAGWTVTPSTGDILKVANSAGGTSVDYDIIIVGASA